ncbi:hypothetical protein BV25DRAFT_1880143 [Artomyces pyxidatus]|uniref:Uncharacterized protein n=1 Tax=Artomyces pyxidatus TaxID=48021 RepID=A0ACB8TA05_9AGAM|nr:hypothetical protein BV25DRAFT_1880143 [Artomyces pyxidatus]
MSAFPGSPAPRRTNRPTPRQSGLSPPPRRVGRLGSSKPASRLATPIRGGDRPSLIPEDVSMAGMDVDEGKHLQADRGLRPDTVFAKSQELLATFHAHLPAEVRHVLRSADFFRDAYAGDIDTLTGFALVVTSKTCFVWQHTQSLAGVPTCYIFSCPMDYSLTAPFHAFVPYGVSREPGLILVSPSGELRFWDSIGIGLAGGDHYSKAQLELESGETATSLTRADPQTYVASTSQGRMFRLTLTSSGGKYHLAARLFSRPQSSLSLSRFLPSLWSSPILHSSTGNITAIALGPKTALGTDVWALVDSHIQKWNIAAEGWEEIVLEQDIVSIIRPAIQDSLRDASAADAYMDLELIDMAVETSGKVVVLTSYAGTAESEDMGMGSTPRRIYVIVQLSLLTDTFKVEKLINVPYQSTFGASEAPMHPQLQLIMGGSLLVVQFGDAITFCARDTDWRDRIELKSATDRTLGVGVVKDQSELLILTASTMMKVAIDFDEVVKFDPETGKSNLIKSIMTQAILYGSYSENPLQFSFPPEVDEESLMSGAALLSRAILESDHEIVRPNDDLTSQITGRKERISFLIKFINENGVLGKIAQRSRQLLATDAEKLYAAQQLWLRLNEFLSQGHSYSVLNEAVYSYMEQVGEGHHEDFMRAFFRLRISELGKLLTHIRDATRKSLLQMPANTGTILKEANNVTLTILTSALEYREYNRGVYGILGPFSKPWTSKSEVINVVLELFDSTANYVETPSPDHQRGSGVEPKSQLPDLASILFACITERLDWLQSAVAGDEPGIERERTQLEDRFRQLRPEVLDTLRRNGFSDNAFHLAEQYQDFRSLASLCHKDVTYPPEQNPHAAKIHEYIERFREGFTEELYQWYIEHGELRSMFQHEEAYTDYLDKFFSKHSYPSISWIHDLHKGQYDSAAESLLVESENAGNLAVKQLMLSIGKLSHLAQMQEDEGAQDESMLDAFHDGLDFVSVHETLLNELKSALASIRGKQSLDKQVEAIWKEKASMLAGRPALSLIFKRLVRSLLQGKSLSVEDIADVLSLKDNLSTPEDYATALHLLARADNLPDVRRLAAFRTVWRRIYIHDDWETIRQTIGLTDAELNERFCSTALFAALTATLPKRHQPTGYILSPTEALPAPSTDELASRWSGMSPEQMETLAADYQAESALVAEYDLSEAYLRARGLVLSETLYGQESEF